MVTKTKLLRDCLKKSLHAELDSLRNNNKDISKNCNLYGCHLFAKRFFMLSVQQTDSYINYNNCLSFPEVQNEFPFQLCVPNP